MFQDLLSKYSGKYPQLLLDSDYKQLTKNLQFIEQACSHNYSQLKEELLLHHQEVSWQKEQLAVKLNKLQELESY